MSDLRVADASGVIDTFMPYFPGVNCVHCGQFIGRDGAIYIETWEMSDVIASMDGECGRCLREDRMGKLYARLR
jgi:hypothetical protein